MSSWLLLAGAAMATFLCRAVVLVGFTGRPLPQRLLGWLQLAGPAALAALVATHVAMSDHGGVDLAVVVAAAGGFIVVRRTGNVLMDLVVGMPILWIAHVAGLH